jgi:hypothetical protein
MSSKKKEDTNVASANGTSKFPKNSGQNHQQEDRRTINRSIRYIFDIV